MSRLRLNEIGKRFGATVALDRVSFDLEPGQVLAIVGENGAGKSTLLNILAGLLRPDQGTMEFDDHGGLSYIQQELSLFPHLSAAENMFMGENLRHLSFIRRAELNDRCRKLLARFGWPEIPPETRVSELSPASRQVVEICRALRADAKVILMDEPTSSLQQQDVERLFGLIRNLVERGISIVYVSHFLEEIRRIAHRLVVLRDGAAVWMGKPENITDAELITNMVGRRMETIFRKARTARIGDVALTARDPFLELRRGEILGIAGLVGSGRTEMVRRLLEGERRANPFGVGYLTEDRKHEGLLPHLSIRENVTITRPLTRMGWIDEREEGRQTARWMTTLNIRAGSPDDSVRYLSGGNQQKVLIARLLHQNADVVLLDEPTRGVDIGSKVEIYEQIHRMADEGKAILMVSSYLPELFGICDRLAVMSKGRLSPARPISDWTPDSVIQAAIGDRVEA